jgi:hypothetical protein
MIIPEGTRVSDSSPRILGNGGDRGLDLGSIGTVTENSAPARRIARSPPRVIRRIHPDHDLAGAPGRLRRADGPGGEAGGAGGVRSPPRSQVAAIAGAAAAC